MAIVLSLQPHVASVAITRPAPSALGSLGLSLIDIGTDQGPVALLGNTSTAGASFSV